MAFCLFLLLATHENKDIFFAYIKVFYLSLGGAFPPCFPSLKKQMFSKLSGKGTYHMGIHVWAGGVCEGWLPGRFCRLGLMVPGLSSGQSGHKGGWRRGPEQALGAGVWGSHSVHNSVHLSFCSEWIWKCLPFLPRVTSEKQCEDLYFVIGLFPLYKD